MLTAAALVVILGVISFGLQQKFSMYIMCFNTFVHYKNGQKFFHISLSNEKVEVHFFLPEYNQMMSCIEFTQ